mgnify:CR=1 FL=1
MLGGELVLGLWKDSKALVHSRGRSLIGGEPRISLVDVYALVDCALVIVPVFPSIGIRAKLGW